MDPEGRDSISNPRAGLPSRPILPRRRVDALEPWTLALMRLLEKDRTADPVLERGARARWRDPARRRTWARLAARKLFGIPSTKLALAIEGSLNEPWTAERGWLQVPEQIAWPPAGTVKLDLQATLSPAQVRHFPQMTKLIQQRARRALEQFERDLTLSEPRGRKSLFTEEFWRDAKWACWRLRERMSWAQICEREEALSGPAYDAEYVRRRVGRFLRDGRLTRTAPVDPLSARAPE